MNELYEDDILGVTCVRAIVYNQPNGDRTDIICRHIYEDDAKYIYENDLILSMEDNELLGYVLYLENDRDEELETTCISNGRNCHECIKELVESYKGLCDDYR